MSKIVKTEIFFMDNKTTVKRVFRTKTIHFVYNYIQLGLVRPTVAWTCISDSGNHVICLYGKRSDFDFEVVGHERVFITLKDKRKRESSSSSFSDKEE